MSGRRRTTWAASLLVAALGAALSCTSTTPAPTVATTATTAPAAATSSPSSYWDWETATREQCDALLGEADQLRAEERPAEALDCLDQALATLLEPPPGYPARPVYLDYIAELLDQEDAVEAELTGSDETDATADDQLMKLITSELTGPSTAVPAPEPSATSGNALPNSDLPLVLNDSVGRLLRTLTDGGEIRRRVARGLARAGQYLPMIREHLRAAGLPEDLAYLPLIESAFSPSAYSRARACGLWQFVASTARLYGLRVGPLVDERRDPERATEAAVAHLADLYNEFGDWPLALAAYNSGAGNVRRAIRRAGSSDFWSLSRYLPRETRSYVPAFFASLIVAKDPTHFGLTAPAEHPWDYDEITVPDALDLEFLADHLSVSLADLRELNPALTRGLTPARHNTRVRLPDGLGDDAQQLLASVPRTKWAPRMLYTVRRGDTLSGIANRNGSSVAAIRQANGLRGSLIRPGQTLLVPRWGARGWSAPTARRVTSDGHYTVRASDTLWDIARSLGVSVEALCSANGLDRTTVIHPGQRLAVPGDHDTTRRSASARGASGGNTYRVQRGDTLFDIARRFGTSVRALRHANGLRSNRIYPGDVLRIPASQAEG